MGQLFAELLWPGTVLGTEDLVVNKEKKVPELRSLYEFEEIENS